VGLSLLSGAHNELVMETLEKLRELDGGDIAVFVGGTIPEKDREHLKSLGVVGVYTSEMALEQVLRDVEQALR